LVFENLKNNDNDLGYPQITPIAIDQFVKFFKHDTPPRAAKRVLLSA
jgi:hypothetical protein